MSTSKERLYTGVVVAIVLAIAVATGLWLKSRVESGAVMPHAAPVVTVTPDTEIPFERYFDWNDVSSVLAESMTPFVAERLGMVRPDRVFQPLLARQVEIQGDLAVVVLRRDVYWSDRASLIASQVVAAFERAKLRSGKPGAAGAPIKPHWYQTVILEAATDATLADLDPVVRKSFADVTLANILIVSGYEDTGDLHALLSHRILAPIRPELVNEPQGSDDGWRVTLGRYMPRSFPGAPLSAKTVIDFDPNPSYFRGPATSPFKLTIRDLADASR